MTKTLQFFIPIKPPTTTFQQVTITKKGKIFKGKAQATYDTLTAHMAPHRPDRPFEPPISLTITWCFQDARRHGEWKTTRPDLDNMEKALLDVMERLGYYRDDAHICEKITRKVWQAQPGIFIRISEICEQSSI